ncbi:MAG: bifunctional riboflavin kinase/FAD synthetase [Bacteroidetes bacterium]|nr:bifunctional riboflavin kinase/FAD synthetase [Bacteroidota bacterium]
MRIYHHLQDLPVFNNLVLTQGTFDGVHTGHKHVLQKVVEKARSAGGESMLLTFYPHPRLVLYPEDNSLRLLSTLEEKARLVAACGIDHLLVLPFTDEVARLSPLDFVRSVLVEKLNVHNIVVGYDHRFGRNREGSFNDLVEMGMMFNFSVDEIPASEIDHIAISSTRIRQALLQGDLKLANELLGHHYELSGTVVHGRKLGREIGFPTANIQPTEPFKLIPSTGVYMVRCHIGVENFNGVMNIGNNPTIPGKGFSIEAHLFDFMDNIYDIAVRFEIIQFIRAEQKFENVEELKEKIQQDVETAKAAFQHL